MQEFYMVRDADQLKTFQRFAERYRHQWQSYLSFLREAYDVLELPQALVWADETAATEVIREILLPAYTNDIRLVMTPDLAVWKTIYLKQLDDYPTDEVSETITRHYENLSDNHLLQIIGHELAHWSERFMDDFDGYDSYIWFEEGMVEYISRRYFLTETEFAAEKAINQLLVERYQDKHGWHSLNNFGQATYEGDYASIFYEYWRSFLTIDRLVTRLGSVEAVFEAYGKWQSSDTDQPLLNWFIAQGILETEV